MKILLLALILLPVAQAQILRHRQLDCESTIPGEDGLERFRGRVVIDVTGPAVLEVRLVPNLFSDLRLVINTARPTRLDKRGGALIGTHVSEVTDRIYTTTATLTPHRVSIRYNMRPRTASSGIRPAVSHHTCDLRDRLDVDALYRLVAARAQVTRPAGSPSPTPGGGITMPSVEDYIEAHRSSAPPPVPRRPR